MTLNNMIPRQTAFHMDKINKELTIYREMRLNNLEIQIGTTIVCLAKPGIQLNARFRLTVQSAAGFISLYSIKPRVRTMHSPNLSLIVLIHSTYFSEGFVV